MGAQTMRAQADLNDLQDRLDLALGAGDRQRLVDAQESLSELARDLASLASDASAMARVAAGALTADALVVECEQADPFKPAYMSYHAEKLVYRCTHDTTQGNGPHEWPA